MDNNIIKVQLASSTGLSMKIETKEKNTISENEQSFEVVLSQVSDSGNEQKVWNKDADGQFIFPVAYGLEISEAEASTHQAKKSISSNAQSYASIIAAASEKYGVPQNVIEAVIQAESAFNTNVTSSAGAKGLMQLMDGTAKGLGVTNSYDPEQNINGGTKYLAMLLQKFNGELKPALAAYNAGPTRIDRAGISTNEQFDQLKAALPEETQNYVKKIISYI